MKASLILNKLNKIPNTSFLIIILSFLSISAFQDTNNDDFIVVQMSDTQFGFFNDNKSFEKETANFKKAVQAANRLSPAFIIVTGDLVNKTFDTQQIAEYKRIALKRNSGIDLYNVAGNHDTGNKPTKQDIESYKKEFGPDYYTIKYRNLYAIVLNSLYLHSPENVIDEAREQETWLVKKLEEAKKGHYDNIFIFLHHPLFLNNPDEADDYFNIPVKTRKYYLELFRRYNVSHIFAGHYHRNASGKYGEMEMVTTGSVGRPLGKDPSGLRIITISGKNVDHKYYNLDSIPEKILNSH
jgi:serine/threonine-protein phosphatase CPPED1